MVSLPGCPGSANAPLDRGAVDGAADSAADGTVDLAADGAADGHLPPKPDLAPLPDTKPAPPHAATQRKQMSYYAIPHPDDEFQAWSLIEHDAATYPVILTLTRGEKTGYCEGSGFKGYQPALGELPPGNDPTYLTRTCKQNRVGSALAFFAEMCAVDPYLGPMPSQHVVLTGKPLPAGTPGQGCAVSSQQLDLWIGRNMALIFFDLGDGDLTSCEVQWAISQARALRGTYYLPALVEQHVVAAGFRNKSYPGCYVYDHPDHHAAHQAVWSTDFGTPGHQYGRTCTTDPDHSLVKSVTQYQAVMAMSGTLRVGALQRVYGWLKAIPWPAGSESVTHFSQQQAFWSRF